jgi:transcriptional regulator GlxA family with amidase domain
VYQWALHNLHQPLPVDQLAHQAGMSRRTLIRRFYTDTAPPPSTYRETFNPSPSTGP